MKREHPGLTLIELLAATMILTAVVGAGIGVLQQARSALPHDALERQAWSVLERFEAAHSVEQGTQSGVTEAGSGANWGEAEGSEEKVWQWVSIDARRWRVRVRAPEPMPPEAENDTEADPFALRLVWGTTLVETVDDRGAWIVVLECPAPRRPSRVANGASR